MHTPIVVRNTCVGLLRPRSVRGRLQAKPERLCFVTHPRVLYKRRRIAAISAANRQSESEDGCYREKFRNFVAWAEPDPKQHFSVFRCHSTVLRTAYRKQFYHKPMVPMESRECGHVTITKIENLHRHTQKNSLNPKMLFSSISDEK